MALAPMQTTPESAPGFPIRVMNGESIDTLRRMILGQPEDQYTDHQRQYVFQPRVSRSSDWLIIFALIKARKIHCPRL